MLNLVIAKYLRTREVILDELLPVVGVVVDLRVEKGSVSRFLWR